MRFVCLSLLLVGAAAGQALLVLTDANLVDGAGAPPRAHAQIVIAGERIQAIQDASAPPPAGAEIWNLHGMTVIPGLIDGHVHLTPAASDRALWRTLRFGLMGGVTSVRDMGGDDIVLAEAARRAMPATVASPRIYYSTLVAGPQFFADPRPQAAAHGGVAGQVAWMRALTPDSDVRAIVAAGKATGAAGLKIYADLTAELVERAAAEAHRQGLRVWAHSAVFPARPSETVAAGVDVVSHSVYLGAEGMQQPPASYEQARRGQGIDYASSPVDGDALTRLLRLMKERGTMLDETLFVTNTGKRGESDPIWLWTVAVTKRAHQFGIPLVAGTDHFGDPAHDHMPNIHRELQLLVEDCGLTPLEAIHAATAAAARAIGIDRDYGTLEPGKVADLAILRGDPSRNIRLTESVAAVMKAGVVYRK
ncbi:MAG: amidohydrolase family protein [Bryobacteraceae bacterium]|jgi:imidazolonepropionase-like amidohydrolase